MKFVRDNFDVISFRDLAICEERQCPWPKRGLIITFDDGYRDHYENVFPALRNRSWQGTFFPPLDAIRNRSLLDVNMIHFILASAPDPQAIIAEIRRFAEERGDRAFERYWNEWAKPAPNLRFSTWPG